MNQPTPSLVTQRAAERLPRLPLLLLCAAYVLPGLFGRDPWRNADLVAFGYMQGMADGRMSWWHPSAGLLPAETALLPHWLGAGFIQALSPWLDPALAARLPFGLLLAFTLALVWYATFHLARTNAAQPVPFAFGGEASPVDYARALADGALLAVIATLGLLQLGHETTPELFQLSMIALLLWALAAAPYTFTKVLPAIVLAPMGLALSGAPAVALGVSLLGALLCRRSSFASVRRLSLWLIVACAGSAVLAAATGAWQWRVDPPDTTGEWLGLGRLLLWFTWPVGPMAGWTLWRWRGLLGSRHMAIPLVIVVVALVTCLAMGGSDRALMLAVPGLAILAAFALPTLQRSTGAAIDWFSVFFFTVAGIAIWVTYASLQTGLPPQPLRNIGRLVPGFVPSFSMVSLVLALLGSAGWLALVRWRTARHRHPLWKSLVLPASGVATAWLLTMTLLLPVLDHARSTRALVQEIAQQAPAAQGCIRAPGLGKAHVAGLEVFGHYTVDARPEPTPDALTCPFLLIQTRSPLAVEPEGWSLLRRLRRPVDKTEYFALFQRR